VIAPLATVLSGDVQHKQATMGPGHPARNATRVTSYFINDTILLDRQQRHGGGVMLQGATGRAAAV